MTLSEKLARKGPRKLLALDGGGIRGMLTIEVLAEIERVVRARTNPQAVLADYFDYIAGTSTGAIIATCLSLGMEVASVRDFYVKSGKEMFEKSGLLDRFWKHKFDDDNLTRQLQAVVGKDTQLGSDKLRTLLMIVLRNATTDSPWPVSNNPGAKYNDRNRPDSNLQLPLWQLVRASTAAPTYFPPEVVEIGPRKFVFVDGGVTMYNNPAFQLFMMATTQPYGLGWPTGEDQMLLVSVGTGTAAAASADLRPDDMHLLYNASSIPSALMAAALHEQDFLCRAFGKCLAGLPIDREIGDMIEGAPSGPTSRGAGGPVASKLFTYVRYNAELTQAGLAALGLGRIAPKDVQQMDSIDHIGELQAVGKAVAVAQVRAAHFTTFA